MLRRMSLPLARLLWAALPCIAVLVVGCDRGSAPSGSGKSGEPPTSVGVPGPIPAPELASGSGNTEPSHPAAPENDSDSTDTPGCLAEFEIGRHRSVLEEQRSLGGDAPDFAERYPAEYIDPDTYVPVKAVERYQIGKTPLLWFRPKKDLAVVNAAVLSDLAVADPLSMAAGESAVVGTLGELGRGKISGRALLEFLLYSRAIATYVHIGSEVCLVEEDESEGSYTASVRGEHTFFTSRENVVPFAFRFEISRDGEISVAVAAD